MPRVMGCFRPRHAASGRPFVGCDPYAGFHGKGGLAEVVSLPAREHTGKSRKRPHWRFWIPVSDQTCGRRVGLRVPGKWLTDATAAMGASCKAKLAGPGEPEAAIRSPIEELLAAAGQHLSLTVVPYDEVRDTDRGVRPDYAISVNGAITGYVEIKKPGANLDPDSFTGHNLRQWERQRDLPNLIYTNGTEWRLYRDSQPVGDPVHLTGGALRNAGPKLSCGDNFEQLLTDFLRWKPAPITGVVALVRAVAPLCRLLRGEVLDQLAEENRAIAAGRSGERAAISRPGQRLG